MRLFFIPGFGEEPFIFEKIHPQLPGNKVLIDNWAVLGRQERPNQSVVAYARELVQEFGIGAQDVVIGHSMGGWIALHIKALVGCSVIQIASWTSQDKVVGRVKHHRLAYWAVRRGLVYNKLVQRVLIWRSYRGKASREIFSRILDRLRQGPREKVVNQLQMILPYSDQALQVQPDLRIHARADNIIRFPDEAACEVPGDHFTLYTHPQEVWAPVLDFLKQQGK